MQPAAAEKKGTNPGWPKGELIADREAQIVVVRGRASGRKRCLLDKSVVRCISVEGGARKPVGTLGLRPVQPQHAEIVAERNRGIVRNGNRGHRGSVHGDEALLRELRKRVEFGKAIRTVGDAGV